MDGYKDNEPPPSVSPSSAGWVSCLTIGAVFMVVGTAAVIWALTPSEMDRWVNADGVEACRRQYEEIDYRPISEWHYYSLVDEKCELLYANERVRIHEFTDHGDEARVTLGRDGKSAWIATKHLTAHSSSWLHKPWLWPDRGDPPILKHTLTEKEKAEATERQKMREWNAANAKHIGEEPGSGLNPTGSEGDKLWQRFVQSKTTDKTTDTVIAFNHVKLDHGISLDVPSHWTVLSREAREAIQVAGEHMADAGAGEGEEGKQPLLAVSATPSPSGAMIRVSISPSRPEVTQAALALISELSPSDLEETLGKPIKVELMEKYRRTGFINVLGWEPIEVVTFESGKAILISYTRASTSGGKSNWRVQMYQIPRSSHDISVTLSYRLNDAEKWLPLLERVKSSLRF
jgi:hypothetical protein